MVALSGKPLGFPRCFAAAPYISQGTQEAGARSVQRLARGRQQGFGHCARGDRILSAWIYLCGWFVVQGVRAGAVEP